MEKKSFQPREFQGCTVDWVIHQLFKKGGDGSRRFLVADEVGMGKTIIAKHVIDGIREIRKQDQPFDVVYISSSLDIARQNRDKLVRDPETEIVPVDRITLLYRNHLPKRGLRLFAMTPGTSLSISNTLGSIEERAYLAFLVKKIANVSWDTLSNVFAWPASDRTFFLHLQNLKRLKASYPPPTVLRALEKRWHDEQYSMGDFQNVIRNKRPDRNLLTKDVKTLRRIAAEVFLGELKPDLVIFDEFQKFREVLFTSGTQKSQNLGRYLLAPKQPTLLLSATPYRLFDVANDISEHSSTHYEDLGELFGFLLADKDRGEKLVTEMAEYGTQVLSITPSTVASLVLKKAKLESKVMEVMTRAERSTFEYRHSEGVSTRFLSDSAFANKISKENLYQFLAIARYASSARTFLNYWKSGNHPMSYMREYEAVKDSKRRSEGAGKKLESDPTLFSRFKKIEGFHPKVQYLNHELLNDGRVFDYLWVPPLKPYYSGEGPFSQSRLQTNPVRKGLIFSAWRFVPRMIAAELSETHRKERKYLKISSNPIKANPSSWLRLFFPSPILAKALCHQDFINAQSYKDLLATAKARLRTTLESHGVRFVRNSSNSAWQVLRSLDLPAHSEAELLMVYSGRKRKMPRIKTLEEEGAPFSRRDYEQFRCGSLPNIEIDDKELTLLAETAIASPSVCILRALILHFSNDLLEKTWLEVADLCIRYVRNYINQSANIQAMVRAYPREKTYLSATARYFRDGNFQAVMDEYISLIVGTPSEAGLTSTLKTLAILLSPRRGRVEISTHRAKRRINTDLVAVFGEGVEQSVSKDIARIGFNSPFWPFVLTTTSVGQEGLDFHLYCNEIFHWNLPSNPVDFEQREGRINRYSSLAIRKSLVHLGEDIDIKDETIFWKEVFDQAYLKGHRNDRYNLGLSPHWIFTPTDKAHSQIIRHVLDMPSSRDRTRYETLMRDVSLYRLALGQPKQMEFLAQIKQNQFLRESDPRGFILCFFPFQMRDRKKAVNFLLEDTRRISLLIQDVRDYVNDLKQHPQHGKLKQVVSKQARALEQAMKSRHNKTEIRRLIERLYYFIDVFDEMNDRVPGIGFEDDIDVLKAA